MNAVVLPNPLDSPISRLVETRLEDARSFPRSEVDVALVFPGPKAPYRRTPSGFPNTKSDWSTWVGRPNVVLTLKVLTDQPDLKFAVGRIKNCEIGIHLFTFYHGGCSGRRYLRSVRLPRYTGVRGRPRAGPTDRHQLRRGDAAVVGVVGEEAVHGSGGGVAVGVAGLVEHLRPSPGLSRSRHVVDSRFSEEHRSGGLVAPGLARAAPIEDLLTYAHRTVCCLAPPAAWRASLTAATLPVEVAHLVGTTSSGQSRMPGG